MEEFKIVGSSLKATEKAALINSSKNAKYPFKDLEIGQSFTIQFKETEADNILLERTLRSQCSTSGSRLNRKFSCIKHKDHLLFEIARIA